MAVREFMDGGIMLGLSFCLREGPPHAHEGYPGGLAVFAKTTVPKPGCRAFELLRRMEGVRAKRESWNQPLGGLACIARDGARAWVMLRNLIEEPPKGPTTAKRPNCS